jgi:Acetyltransferase (GNAT) family
MTIIAVEKWDEFYPDCLPLFAEHHTEIVEDGERMPLDLNVEDCAYMNKNGLLFLLAARKEDKLVGYFTCTIGRSLMSRNVICATQAPYFVTESERSSGLGLRLYREAIRLLREQGVHILFPHHWLKGGGEKLGEFFVHLGARPIQHEYSLWIARS